MLHQTCPLLYLMQGLMELFRKGQLPHHLAASKICFALSTSFIEIFIVSSALLLLWFAMSFFGFLPSINGKGSYTRTYMRQTHPPLRNPPFVANRSKKKAKPTDCQFDAFQKLVKNS